MGPAALIGAGLLAVAAAFVAATDSRRARMLLAGSAIALWTAAGRVVVAMVQTDLAFTYVADHSRRGASLFHRVSSLWAGSEGSLLLFTALVATVLAMVPEPTVRLARGAAAALVAGLTGALLFSAYPFERLELPPLDGRGMTPILEHPAMIVHPPLLYLGTILSLAPALLTTPAVQRRTAAWALGILTAALGLGAAWAYGELGWGGWWAWDPVENVALLPWLLLVGSLHTAAGSRQATWLYSAIWPLVFAGVAMTRTSLRTSVHAFANAAGLGWWLWPVAIAAAAIFAAVVWIRRDARMERRSIRSLAQWLVVASVVVIALGTFRPLLPGDGTAGWFFARMLYPVAVIGAAAMGVAPRWPRISRRRLLLECLFGALLGLALALAIGATAWFQIVLAAAVGIGVVTLVGDRHAQIPRWLAHAGMLLVLVGVLGGTASTQRTVRIEEGSSTTIAGRTITNQGVSVTTEPHLAGTDVSRINATLLVGGDRALSPSIGVYTARAIRLAEASTYTRLHEDVQLILRSADDAGTVVVTVNVRPLNQLVWWGAGAISVGAVWSVMRSRRRTRRTPVSE